MTACLVSSGYVMTAFSATIRTALTDKKDKIMHENNDSMSLLDSVVSLIFDYYLLHVCLLIAGILLGGQQRDNTNASCTIRRADVSVQSLRWPFVMKVFWRNVPSWRPTEQKRLQSSSPQKFLLQPYPFLSVSPWRR